MARNLSTQDVSWFLDLNEKAQLDLNPPYQRRSVWSPRDKRFFIDTILNNYPAPPIFLHKSLDENGRPTYHVVDGKQRLQTIVDFTLNRIRIPDDFSNSNLQKKRWRDMDRPLREQFWNYFLIVEMLPDVSDAFVRNIFERINRNSRKLMPQELRHAKYDGWFVSSAEAEADKQEWKELGVVTTARAKRMADVQFISELMGIIITGVIRGFDQDALDDLYADYDDIEDQPTFIEDDFRTKLEGAKMYIRTLLREDPSILDTLKVQSHFYTLWGYLILEASRLPSENVFLTQYKKFLSDVTARIDSTSESPSAVDNSATAYQQAVGQYAANTRGASTDNTPRQERHAALVSVIHEG